MKAQTKPSSIKLNEAQASFRDPKLPPLALDEEEKLEQERLRKIRAKRNDVKDIRNLKMLERIDLDFDSPRMKKAMDDLGVTQEECQKK
jgi:hypothetical protein|tara:strand:- start:570 stop:836 length:267 start_codon:yes stop_codon:yes gene_type:complete